MNAIVILSTLLIFGAVGLVCSFFTTALDRSEQSQIVCVKERLSPSVIYVHRQCRKVQTTAACINADVDASLVWTPKRWGIRTGLRCGQPI